MSRRRRKTGRRGARGRRNCPGLCERSLGYSVRRFLGHQWRRCGVQTAWVWGRRFVRYLVSSPPPSLPLSFLPLAFSSSLSSLFLLPFLFSLPSPPLPPVLSMSSTSTLQYVMYSVYRSHSPAWSSFWSWWWEDSPGQRRLCWQRILTAGLWLRQSVLLPYRGCWSHLPTTR